MVAYPIVSFGSGFLVAAALNAKTVDPVNDLNTRLAFAESSLGAGVQADVSASGTTTSTTYTATLTGSTVPVTPSIALIAGQNCLVIVISELINGTNNGGAQVSFAVSGAATEAATDARGAKNQNLAGAVQGTVSVTKITVYTAPSTGNYLFTMNLRCVNGGTLTSTNRSIVAVPLL